MRCAEEEKVNFATFILLGEAADWWKIEKEKLGPGDTLHTWEEFKRAFYEKYFPRSIIF